MKKIECDRCKKSVEFDYGDEFREIRISSISPEQEQLHLISQKTYHLCPSCLKIIVANIEINHITE